MSNHSVTISKTESLHLPTNTYCRDLLERYERETEQVRAE